jgi:hydroxymethylpyrimidine/phosphomethylpyrimidine kinase
MNNRFPCCLTIAGSDSGGGAGVQADLKTFQELEVYSCSVITALTAQNTCEVKSIHEVPVNFIADQLDAVFSDFIVDVVKIGMLHRIDVIEMVAHKLHQYGMKTIVLDPVMVAKSGDHLLKNDAVVILKQKLIPMASVLTPNIPESFILLGKELHGLEMASSLLELKTRSVLLKGGHLESSRLLDIFVDAEDGTTEMMESLRLDTRNTHGTGCTFSAAIAAYLAKGFNRRDSIKLAKEYLNKAILMSKEIYWGKGQGPVNHGHWTTPLAD